MNSRSGLQAYAALAAASVFFFLIAGCGNSPPELNQTYSQINFISAPRTGRISAELAVYVNADDEDGYENLEFVHIVNEDKQFLWSVDGGSRGERSSRGMKWTGGQRFSTIDGSVPDPGEYRVIVTDKAGERDESSVFIPVIKELPMPDSFPSIVFSDEPYQIEVVSSSKRNLVSFYDSAGKLLGAYASTPGIIRLTSLKDSQKVIENWKRVSVSFYDDSLGAGLIRGPYDKPSTGSSALPEVSPSPEG